MTADFFLAALRGELAALIREAKRFAVLAGREPTPATTAMIRAAACELDVLAFSAIHYGDGWLKATAGLVFGDDDPAAFRVALPAVVRELRAARDRGGIAAWLASPGPLADLEWLYESMPAVEFDFPAPPMENESAAAATPEPVAPSKEARPATGRMDPGSRAIAAAYQLKKQGEPVSVRAACKLAGVDRKTLRENYPEAQAAIEALSEPDRAPRRGFRDRRTGDLHALDSDPDDDDF